MSYASGKKINIDYSSVQLLTKLVFYESTNTAHPGDRYKELNKGWKNASNKKYRN